MVRRSHRKAFTLVEILIVVIILGILAALVVPQFASATDEARTGATRHELEKIRRSVNVYYAKNGGQFPAIAEGDGTWGELVTTEYLGVDPPENPWAGSASIVFGDEPDGGYQSTHGWIFDPATGDVWAGSFNGDDEPYPRP